MYQLLCLELFSSEYNLQNDFFVAKYVNIKLNLNFGALLFVLIGKKKERIGKMQI